MAAPHYRKVELQSPADFTYLYANTVALSRQKLDLNLPPSATNDDKPDPMRERVRELVDEVRDQLVPPKQAFQGYSRRYSGLSASA
jgi:kinetochor protein Mis14/NSL1